MGRPAGEKIRCGNQWTEAKYHAFIKNALRQASRKWAPIHNCKKHARTRRGFYMCAECKKEIPASIKVGLKRTDNAKVDHIKPVIDPNKGFTTWDDVIATMFCEEDNLQVMCKRCHDVKTNHERKQAAERRAKEKEQNE